jgi:peptide-methionine (R)-S-oxide reductase
MNDEWSEKLTPEQYRICRQCGTDPPYNNKYWDCEESGTYQCVCCKEPLFSSNTKFDSGSGWPSFSNPISKEAVSEIIDQSFGMVRTEVKCKSCESHLGHVFKDGPPPTRLRYCINSTSLQLNKLVE